MNVTGQSVFTPRSKTMTGMSASHACSTAGGAAAGRVAGGRVRATVEDYGGYVGIARLLNRRGERRRGVGRDYEGVAVAARDELLDVRDLLLVLRLGVDGLEVADLIVQLDLGLHGRPAGLPPGVVYGRGRSE